MPVYRKQSSNVAVGQILSSLVKSMLEQPTKVSSNSMVTQWVFTNIGELLESEKEDALEFDMVLSILRKLLEISPFEKDPILTPAWLQAVTFAFCRISEFVAKIECSSMPKEEFDSSMREFVTQEYSQVLSSFFIGTFSKFLCNAVVLKDSITESATTMLELLCRQCISEKMIVNHRASVSGMIEIVIKGVSDINFRENWSRILKIATGIFWRVGQQDSDLISPLLAKLIFYRDDRSYLKSYPARAEMDEALCSAAHSIGIHKFCQVAPLNIENQDLNTLKRPYLLSLFNDALELPWIKSGWLKNNLFGQQSLAFFSNELVPLADRMLEKSSSCWESGKQLESKVYETLGIQIWSLFPKICKLAPHDVAEVFPSLAPILGTFLTLLPTENYPPLAHDFRPLVCKGLDSLIDGLNTASDDQIDTAEIEKLSRSRACIASYANRFLSALCNIYTTPDIANLKENCSKGEKLQASHEALTQFYEKPIQRLLRVVDDTSVIAYFEVLVEKQKGSLISSPVKKSIHFAEYALMDLCNLYLPHLPKLQQSEPAIANFYSNCLEFIKFKDSTLQKKAYKALNSLLSLKLFADIQSLSASVLQKDVVEVIAFGSKKQRIRMVQSIVELACEPQFLLLFIPRILPEVMLATKEANEKTRDIAYACLISMARKMMTGSDKRLMVAKSLDLSATLSQFNMEEDGRLPYSGEISIKEFCVMVCAGLSSSESNIQSSCIACLGRLLFEFSGIEN